MNKYLIKDAIEHIVYQPDEFLFTAKYLREYFKESLEELSKPKYHPLGQEPVNQQCLSCGLNCPNDCPLDKEEGK